ncbi:hypothetical protein [Chryseolinea lacunae]|uniref:GLPGLI family protein n=1 Tax=Chryseolinea lacunae TaxID=2801331 RepID=A0ABS1KN08_9BACT|nr:hypothetical protein [Chryseolinea lacunae]MBL0740627.1 hypothetical protein [Chryseolinea lacunae]
MKKSLSASLFVLVLILLTDFAYGTAQEPDILIYQGKTYNLQTNPLEAYFKKFQEKRPKTNSISTSLWRGYRATFEIIDSTLFLRDIDIDSDYGDGKKSVMAEVFSGQSVVWMDWFNGILTLPVGKLVRYVHMGYASTYENYTLLEIRSGRFTKSKDFAHEDYEKFKDSQFELFKSTKEYEEIVAFLRDKLKAPENVEPFIKRHATDYMTYFIED